MMFATCWDEAGKTLEAVNRNQAIVDDFAAVANEPARWQDDFFPSVHDMVCKLVGAWHLVLTVDCNEKSRRLWMVTRIAFWQAMKMPSPTVNRPMRRPVGWRSITLFGRR